MDEYNRPLYGDVFGVLPKAGDTGVRCPSFTTYVFSSCTQVGEPIDKELWGELEPEEGTSITFVGTLLLILTMYLLQKRKKKRARRNQKKKKPPSQHRSTDCRRHQV